jgi:Ca2+:H+ antiporter
MARKDKINLATEVALGSSVQIALLVIPFMVLLGWPLGAGMTYAFQPLEVGFLVCGFLYSPVSDLVDCRAVLLTTMDGRSDYLEGMCLIFVYIVLNLTVEMLIS